MDRWYVRESKKLLKDRLAACVPLLEVALARRSVELFRVPGSDLQARLNQELTTRAYLWGYVTARDELEAEQRRRFRINYMGSPPDASWVGPPPSHAVEWAAQRQVLLGKWDRDLDAAVTALLVQALQTGGTRKELSKALGQTIFPDFSRHRLENIARTESSTSLTQGRLRKFNEPQSRVRAVQFVAILDARTTQMCSQRDGLIMELTDPRLPANTPPLHYQCRSTLAPVSIWDWEDLQNGDPEALERFFAWLPIEGQNPTTLEEALAGWKKADPALPGFGELAPVKRKPKKKPKSKPKKSKPKKSKPKPKTVKPAEPDWVKVVKERINKGSSTLEDLDEIGSLLLEQLRIVETEEAVALKSSLQKRYDDAVANLERLGEEYDEIKDLIAQKISGSSVGFTENRKRFDTMKALIAKAESEGDEKTREIALKIIDDLNQAYLDLQVAFDKAKWSTDPEIEALLARLAKNRVDVDPLIQEKWDAYGLLANAKTDRAQGTAALKVLSQIRDFGGVEQDWQKGSNTATKKAVMKASKYIPKDWLQASRDKGPMLGKKRKRAYYNSFSLEISASEGDRLKFRLDPEEDGIGTALHEMMHRCEHSIKEVADLGIEFREKRTDGEKVQPLSTWLGKSYSSNEVGKKDKFSHAYMGKVYYINASEIVSMGAESLFFSEYELDEEYLKFILGLFAAV